MVDDVGDAVDDVTGKPSNNLGGLEGGVVSINSFLLSVGAPMQQTLVHGLGARTPLVESPV